MYNEFLEDKKYKSSSSLFLRSIQLIGKRKYKFILGIILLTLIISLDLVPGFLFRYIINLIDNPTNVEYAKKMVIIMISTVATLVFFGCFIFYYEKILMQKLGQEIILDLRNDLYRHVLSLSHDKLNQFPVGKLVNRVCNDTNSVSSLYTDVFVNLVVNILMIIVSTILLAITSWKLTLIIYVIVLLLFCLAFIFKHFSRKQYNKTKTAISELNGFLAENLSGVKITQIFNQEDKKNKEFQAKTRYLRNSHFKEIYLFGVFRPLIYFVSSLGTITLLMVSIFLTESNEITVGEMVSFYLLMGHLFNPILWITEQFNMIQDSLSSIGKIESLYEVKPTINDVENPISDIKLNFDIEFKNVWFSYDDKNWILKNVSFKVNKGETCAFIGATGSGKTTILNLIVHNYEPQKGEILIDGIDIKKIKIDTLRSQIGQMLQDVFLFNDTIKNNITLQNPNVTEKDMIDSCKYVGVDHLIDSLDGKYEYKVLERGNNFSSGERQLLSFARTLCSKPRLLILDEATANIDSETEQIVQKSLKKMMKDHTMLIVAHRLSTIQHSDKIIVLSKGEIVEIGNHQELLKLKNHYYNLYMIQKDKNLK